MVLRGMQGTPYIYQGEEIGMTNPHFSHITDYRDVESRNVFAGLRAQGREAVLIYWLFLPANPAITAARPCGQGIAARMQGLRRASRERDQPLR